MSTAERHGCLFCAAFRARCSCLRPAVASGSGGRGRPPSEEQDVGTGSLAALFSLRAVIVASRCWRPRPPQPSFVLGSCSRVGSVATRRPWCGRRLRPGCMMAHPSAGGTNGYYAINRTVICSSDSEASAAGKTCTEAAAIRWLSTSNGGTVEVQSAERVQPRGFTPELFVGASAGG